MKLNPKRNSSAGEETVCKAATRKTDTSIKITLKCILEK
jgi:hypothetical protein